MKPSLLATAIAATAFGASTIYLAVQLRDEREQAELVSQKMTALNARIAELENARKDLDLPRFGDAPSPPDEVRPQPAVAVAGPAPTPEAGSPGDRGPREGFGPPERTEAMVKMMRMQLRANNKRLYSDLGEKLGLNKEDANKLIDLLTDQQIRDMERMRQERMNNSGGEMRANADMRQQNKDEVAALIGQDKMAQLEEYSKSLPARQEVDMISRQLEAGDSSLTKDQRDRLITALTEERSRVPQPSSADMATREEYLQARTAWQQDYNERTTARARGILNNEQMTTYSEYLQYTTEMRQQFEARREARRANGGAALPPQADAVAAPAPR